MHHKIKSVSAALGRVIVKNAVQLQIRSALQWTHKQKSPKAISRLKLLQRPPNPSLIVRWRNCNFRHALKIHKNEQPLVTPSRNMILRAFMTKEWVWSKKLSKRLNCISYLRLKVSDQHSIISQMPLNLAVESQQIPQAQSSGNFCSSPLCVPSLSVPHHCLFLHCLFLTTVCSSPLSVPHLSVPHHCLFLTTVCSSPLSVPSLSVPKVGGSSSTRSRRLVRESHTGNFPRSRDS